MIYFDYNATAPLHKNVIKKIQSLKFEEFGNPSLIITLQLHYIRM